MNIGQYNTLEVARILPQGAYLTDNEDEVLLPGKYMDDDLDIGDELDVFVYCDSEDRPVATTERPKATVGQFAVLKAIDKIPNGTFFDWGLEKDLLVPAGQTHKELTIGEYYVLRVLYDDVSGRLLGTTRIKPFLNTETSSFSIGQKVNALVYEVMENVCLCIVDNEFSGMVPRNEFKGFIRKGTEFDLYVKTIDEQGFLTLSFAPEGIEAIETKKDDVEKALEEAGGFLPYHDKSKPEDIKDYFGISKKSFKKIIGNLYRSGRIEILDTGIQLKNKP